MIPTRRQEKNCRHLLYLRRNQTGWPVMSIVAILRSTISFSNKYAFLKITCHSSSNGSIISWNSAFRRRYTKSRNQRTLFCLSDSYSLWKHSSSDAVNSRWGSQSTSSVCCFWKHSPKSRNIGKPCLNKQWNKVRFGYTIITVAQITSEMHKCF